MALYKIEINKKVRKKDLADIPQKDVLKIINCIKELANNPYPASAVRLRGREEWRLRKGSYRILYVVNEIKVTVFVVKVGHRREVYR